MFDMLRRSKFHHDWIL